MRRLLTGLVLLIGMNVYGQDVYYSSEYSLGRFEDVGRFDYELYFDEPPVYKPVKITIYNDRIWICDSAGLSFQLVDLFFEDVSDSVYQKAWYVVNDLGVTGWIKIRKEKGRMVLFVYYPSSMKAVRYSLKK